MTHNEFQLAIHEDIICDEDSPDVVRERVTTLLAGLPADDETMGAVLHEARAMASARHFEFEMLDGDCERVIGVQDGVIEPAIAWLQANGLPDARRHVFGRLWWLQDEIANS